MPNLAERAQQLVAAKRRALEGRYPALARTNIAERPSSSGQRVAVGRDSKGLPLTLDEISRREHMHVIGTTGAGKSNLIEHMARQDILNGRGVLVVDPHGNHPDSPFRRLLTWVVDSGIAKSRTIHVIDPNNPTHTTGFNPLSLPEGYDPAVVAEAGLEAFQRLWADEDPDSKPTIQRLLPAVLTVLSERGLTLAEALAVLDPDDKDGIRSLLWLHDMGGERTGRRDLRIEVMGPRNRIAKLMRAAAIRTMVGQTERVIDLREAMDESHIILANLAGGARVYEKGADLLGRLVVRFLCFHAKRRQKPHQPFGVYLDECQRYLSGDMPVILAELRKQGVMMLLAHQWSTQLSKVDEEILSAVRNATNIKAVFRVKDPIEAADLAEMGIPLNLELPVDMLTKETVVAHELRRMSNANAGRNTLRSRSLATSETTSTGVTQTKGESEGESTTRTVSEQRSAALTFGQSRSTAIGKQRTVGSTVSHNESCTDSESEGTTISRGASRSRGGGSTEQHTNSSGKNFAQSFNVPMNMWRSGEYQYRRAAVWEEGSDRNVTRGYNSGESHARGASQQWSEGESHSTASSNQRSQSWSVAEGTSESESYGRSKTKTESQSESATLGLTRGVSLANGVNKTQSTSVARSDQVSSGTTTGTSIGDGQSSSSGWSEGLVPILAKRAASVHSKENVLYQAAQMLRSLPSGTCFINWVDRNGMQSAMLRVPLLPPIPVSDEEFYQIRRTVLDDSPSAMPIAHAERQLAERRQRLLATAHAHSLPEPAPPEPESFRTPIRKGTPSG
jgi:hypothetical protein